MLLAVIDLRQILSYERMQRPLTCLKSGKGNRGWGLPSEAIAAGETKPGAAAGVDITVFMLAACASVSCLV